MFGIINALMGSPSWKSSVFILSFDESSGFYDHVPPQPAVRPDGIPPQDLRAGDVCTSGGQNSPVCHFQYTGFRVPLLVISPFTRKNYVSQVIWITCHDLIVATIRFRPRKRFRIPSDTPVWSDVAGIARVAWREWPDMQLSTRWPILWLRQKGRPRFANGSN